MTTYAPIEDLDPEPPVPAGRGRRREVLLAGLLLLGVLLFAGWDWQQQEREAAAYRVGDQAARAQQWDAAAAAFGDLGTYRDAAKRAAQAAANVAERDRLYGVAQTALASANYPQAMIALQGVAALQVTYRDTVTLTRRVEGALLGGVLSDTVALRPTAQPPGLYRYAAGAWEWLAGSDPASQVLATGAPRYVLYDGPNPGLPRATGTRVVVRADLGSSPAAIRTFTLNPDDFNSYRVSAAGVWGIVDRRLRSPQLARVQGYGTADLTYQAASDPRYQALVLPGPDWMVLDLAPDGIHYLLADLSQATGDLPTSLLYYAGGASRPQPLYAVPGLVLHAQFSPDGRRVLLLSTESQADRTQDVQYVRLLDRTQLAAQAVLDPAAVRTLLQQAVTPSEAPGVSAIFLTDGPHAGQIVLLHQAAAGSTISLYDPATPDALPDVLWTGPGRLGAGLWVRESAGDPGLVFGWQPYPQFRDGDALIYVSKGTGTLTLRPWLLGQRLGTAWLFGDYLVYLSAQLPPAPTGMMPRVYSLPLAGLLREPPVARHFGDARTGGGPISASTLLYSGDLSPGGQGWPLVFGPSWFAMLSGTDLHVRTYDGSLDVTLDHGVAALYALAAPFAPDAVHTLP